MLLVDAEWATPAPVAVEAVVIGASADDDSPEARRALFSWAESMAEEPDEPERRRRKPEPASISLFEWASERAELATAGR